MYYLYGSAAAAILIFVLIILRKETRVVADYLLIAINLLFGLFMMADVWVMAEMTSASVIFQNAVPLLILPTFVFYVLQYLKSGETLSAKWYALYLPFISMLILSVTDHYVLGNYPSQADVQAHFESPSIWYQIIFKGSQLLFISLFVWVIKQLNQYEKKIKDGYSTIDKIDLKWLKAFTYIYLFAISATFVLFLAQNLGIIPFRIQEIFGVIYGILVLSVFYLSYQGINHYTIEQYKEQTPNLGSKKDKNPVYIGRNAKPAFEVNTFKIENRVVESDKLAAIERNDETLEIELLMLIESKELYLEPRFSLDDLAGEIDINKNAVSRIINRKKDRTFFSLINGYRVKHFKKLMDDPKNRNLTILAMGLDSGFNSKASINRIFKNITGLTPKQYMEKTSQNIPS